MRGDSRRDFYAKALALLGLGLLGATAAVVDNWPAGSVVSTAPVAGSDGSAAPLRLDLRKFNVTSDAPAVARVAVVRAPVRPEPMRPSASVALPSVGVTLATLPPARPVSLLVQNGVPHDVPFLTASLVDAPEEAPAVFVGPVEDHEYRMSEASRSAAVGAAMNEGFFSGAVKKTQDTLAKTGSTIADAFRAVGGAVGAMGGAVKRVMPF